MVRACLAIVVLALAAMGAAPVSAQVPTTAVPSDRAAQTPSEIDISADSLEYLADQRLIIGTGNVVIREGDDVLQADYVSVNRETRDVHAKGNVVLRRGKSIWQGEELKYNLRTRTGDFGAFQAYYEPFYIRAEGSKRISTNLYQLQGVILSTCEGDPPDFSIRAREATLIPGERIVGKGVTMNFGNVPVLWLPRLSRGLKDRRTYWVFEPGYSSRMGVYLRSQYNIRWVPGFRSSTDIDLYSRKGVGVGQGFHWDSENRTEFPYSGYVKGYYIEDREPFRSEAEREREKDLVDNERYRIKLAHNQSYSARDFLISEFNYVSDPEFLKDFFRDEHISGVRPENRATLTHVGDNYIAALQLNLRLNDFYENVNRTPELRLKANRQQLGDSGFYYESDNTASYLTRVFPEGSERKDYDAFRLDSGHMLYYPTRHFGFLNVTPRAGYRGTYYSDTISRRTVTNDVVVTDTNGIVSVVRETNTVELATGADLRNVYELGAEVSFKAFRTWDDLIVLQDGDGLRHVAEPFVRHTYVPEPNLLPERLPQFDAVDRVRDEHTLRLGMRNKWQTRRDRVPVDLVNALLFTDYRIEKDRGEEDFSDVFFDVELRLARTLPIDFDGAYDPYEGEFSRFSLQAALIMADASTLSLDYNYGRDDYHQAGAELKLFPNNKWSFLTYARWDLDEGDLQEHSYFVQRSTACLGYGVGFRQIRKEDGEEDDNRIWIQIWLTAFPEGRIRAGG